jgi:tRNA modification GTPase
MIRLDTIFALSTGSGRAGIAVVRLSGPDVAEVLKALAGEVTKPRQAVVRTIRSRNGNDVIDQSLVLFFPGPASVTGEDVGEFHTHGSPAVVERLLLELAGFENCRSAEPGEFTRRAFQNERLDLVEVEGLADLLLSETEAQRRLAMRQFSGEASSVYHQWHSDLTGALAIIEASIDFADEDGVAVEAMLKVRPRLAVLRDGLVSALQESERAALVRRGLRIVIAGAPNVGKSSLLNALTGRRAAIVSEIAGTTRDVVEAPLVINGLAVSVSDTAGLREATDDAIEQEGIARSRSEIDAADIVIWVTLAGEAVALPERVPELVVHNKSDLVKEYSIQLRERLSLLVASHTHVSEHAVMVRSRHRTAVTESIRSLNDALSKRDDALELMAEDVRKAAQSMASITGRIGVEDFLGRIFSEFCVGK